MKIEHTLAKLSGDELLRRLSALVQDSRRIEAELIAHIAEVDRRRLFAREATSSMFAYCLERLHLSEGEAFLRIQVARATRRFPVLLDMLADGRMHLTGIAKLVPHLTAENIEELLERATHKSKREIEEMVAEVQPRPDVPTSVRKLPTRRVFQPRPDEVGKTDARSAGVSGPVETSKLGPDEVARPAAAHHARPAAIQPLAPARFKVQFSASAVLREKLERIQALMPDADLAQIIDEAVTEKLERLEARRFAKTKSPRKALVETDTTPSSRHIPAAVRRTVYERDGGRCRYVDACGRRCTSRRRLEFHHHDQPYARCGDHSPDNIRLMCRTHNALLAERDYGEAKMARFLRLRDPASEAAASSG